MADVFGDDDSRARHPATWRPDRDLLHERLAEHLRRSGHRWPELAAAVLAERGRLDLDRVAFALHCGVHVEDVTAAEDGSLARHDVPQPLLRLVDGV